MVIDSSVIIQILFDEPHAHSAVRLLHRDPSPCIAAPNALEAEIVYGVRFAFGTGVVTELLQRLGIGIVPFTAEHLPSARLAYERFSKRSGHPAHLNFGDCIAYAVATSSRERLAYKGNGFELTDVQGLRTDRET